MKVAVISDIHGNLDAFERVLEDIDGQGVNRIFCLGDSVGYGAQPEEVVQLLRAREIPQVLGNHEYALVRREQRAWFNPNALQALSNTGRLISEETREYILTLPFSFTWGGALFVHGCPPNSVRTYLYDLDDDGLRRAFSQMRTSLCFVGHTHDLEYVEYEGLWVNRKTLGSEPITLQPDIQYILNVGSVGQPRDGDGKAKYALWAPEAGIISIRHVEYYRKAAAQKILDKGFPEQYANRLLR